MLHLSGTTYILLTLFAKKWKKIEKSNFELNKRVKLSSLFNQSLKASASKCDGIDKISSKIWNAEFHLVWLMAGILIGNNFEIIPI